MCFSSDTFAMKEEQRAQGVSEDTRGSRSGKSSNYIPSALEQPDILNTLDVSDNNKCTKARALEIKKKLAKFFHHNALPFNLMESDKLADLVKALCSAYYQQGRPRRFWMRLPASTLLLTTFALKWSNIFKVVISSWRIWTGGKMKRSNNSG
jgi:hypothetical protein